MTTHTAAASPGAAIDRYLRALSEPRPGRIDWSAAPGTHKRYPAAGRLPLAEDTTLGTLLRNLLGITRVEWTHPVTAAGLGTGARPRVRLGRPAASGGGLYPIEAYVATDGGLFHYDPAHHALDLLRDGDHREAVAALVAAGAGACGPGRVC